MLLTFAHAASDSPCHPVSRFDVPMTRGDMADMLGLTIETVSRQLSVLEREAVIARHGRRGIELIDVAALADRAA